MAKTVLFKLENHPFYVEVDKNYVPLVMKINDQMGDFDEVFARRNIPKEIDFTPQEYYCYRVFAKLLAFSNVYRNLKYAHLYISELDSPQKHEKYGIHKFDYLTYHYTIHVLSYVSVLDTALILASTVFQLGLKDEKCKYDMVVSKITHPLIQNDLEKIKALVGKYKKIRNRFLHHGKLPSIVDVNNSDVLYFLQLLKSESRKIKKMKSDYKDGINFIYKSESQSILDKLNADVAFIESAVSDFLNHLLAVYRLANTLYKQEALE